MTSLWHWYHHLHLPSSFHESKWCMEFDTSSMDGLGEVELSTDNTSVKSNIWWSLVEYEHYHDPSGSARGQSLELWSHAPHFHHWNFARGCNHLDLSSSQSFNFIRITTKIRAWWQYVKNFFFDHASREAFKINSYQAIIIVLFY